MKPDNRGQSYVIIYRKIFFVESTHTNVLQVSTFLRKQLKLKDNDPLVSDLFTTFLSSKINHSSSNTHSLLIKQFVLSESRPACWYSFEVSFSQTHRTKTHSNIPFQHQQCFQINNELIVNYSITNAWG